VNGTEQQSWTGRVDRFPFEKYSRLAGKFSKKSSCSALQRFIPNTCDRNAKRLINWQSPYAGLNRSRHGHEVERGLGLCLGVRSKEKRRTGD
jgi:hypothetical protein